MSDRAILYRDADGNEVTALDLVTSVTVSVGDKVSIKEPSGNIRTIAPMISMTATIPPEQQSGEIAMEVARQLYAQINSMVAGITHQKLGLPVNGNGHHEEPEKPAAAPPGPPESESGPDPELTQETPPIPLGKMLQFAPKAADRNPGDWWVYQATKYNWHGFTSSQGNDLERIFVWYQDGKFERKVSLVEWGADKWPPENVRAALQMVKDDQDHTFPMDVFLTFQVGEGKNANNNYEPLLVKWAASAESARLAPAA